MIQCEQCEFYGADAAGRKGFKCDPFSSVKEPECIAKWQLIRLDMLLASYQDMLKWYGRLAPLQDKIFKYVQREISDMEDSDQWKLDQEEGRSEESSDDWPV